MRSALTLNEVLNQNRKITHINSNALIFKKYF